MNTFMPVHVNNVFTPEEAKRVIEICEAYGVTPGTTYHPGKEVEEQLADEVRIAEDVRPPLNDETRWIVERCQKVIDFSNAQFQFNLSKTKPLEWCFVKYPTGGHFGWHNDTLGVGDIRKITGSIQLSDDQDYAVGHLEVHGTRLCSHDLGAGMAFPSFTNHKVHKVYAGTRYALVFWAHGDEPFK